MREQKLTLALPAEANNTSQMAGKQPSWGEYQELLTVVGILEKLPISRRTLCDHVKHGRIPAIKLGKRVLFHWGSVEAALLRLQRGAE